MCTFDIVLIGMNTSFVIEWVMSYDEKLNGIRRPLLDMRDELPKEEYRCLTIVEGSSELCVC